MNILVSGSLAYDKILDFPGHFKDHLIAGKAHTLSVSFTAKRMSENFGGTAGNIAYNLALLGERPTILASAGNDFAPYKRWCERHKMDTSHVRVVRDEPTAVGTMITDLDDNQIAAFYEGAMRHRAILGGALPRAAFAIAAAGNVKEASRLYRAKRTPFVFDPGQQIPILSKRDLLMGISAARVVVGNDYELSMVMKKTGLRERDLIKKVPIVVITYGIKGSRIFSKGKSIAIPSAKATRVLDPTGAGDAYRAGFIKGLLHDWPLPVAGRFAGVVAAYTVEQYGTQTHTFTLQGVKTRYRKNFGRFSV